MSAKSFPQEYNELLDIDIILKNTNNLENLKVILKKDPIKGAGLYATKQIVTDETIAYYKITVFDYRYHKSPTNYVYAFGVYTLNEKESKNLLGDIDLNSFPEPLNNIPFWAAFVNEPSNDQSINSRIDLNTSENYKGIKIMRKGRQIIYKLIATKDIMPDEEITIYYGKDYPRTYEINVEEEEDADEVNVVV